MKNNTLFRNLLVIIILVLAYNSSKSQIGDTINLQTFTFGSSQDSFFIFPPDTNRYEKILMHYKLKCNSLQNPACGEWDYLTYTYLYQHTHQYDSTLLSAPSYRIGGNSPDSVQYMNTPSYSYYPVWHYNIVYDNIINGCSATIGTGSITSIYPFNASNPQTRTQYLWKASELTAAGLHAGNITNLRLNIYGNGTDLSDLTIRFKNSSLTALSPSSYESTGLSLAYDNNVSFPTIGWQVIFLTQPFSWDGVSNLVIDISYTNTSAGVYTKILADTTNFASGIYSSGDDRSLKFSGVDQVNVPAAAAASLDSFITVAFWCYGNPALQPQNNSAFEAYDAQGHRVLNVHMPWSDGSVYWDCGNSGTGSYDRVNAAVPAADWEGKWNYWTFTKNVATGIMKAYVNGNVLFSGTAKIKRMYGINKFYFGSGAANDYYYGGNLDEFAVWNKELDQATIQAYMFKDLDATHPFSSNLILYYQCNDNSYSTVSDASTLSGNNGTLMGVPTDPQITGPNLFRNFNSINARPYIVFEQDSFTSHIDSVLTIDSVENAPFQIVQYLDFSHPLVPTDTLLVWSTYYRYIYNSAGVIIDSIFITPNNTLHLIHTPYYSTPFEIVNRFEIGRFITPYGINLSLGAGFTWTEDVSDYKPLLHDTVYLSAGNWQELLDVSFEFKLGVPPRDPFSVKNIWNGAPGYNGIGNFLVPKTLTIDPLAINTRYKLRTTGHGEDGLNCLEFCPRNHFLFINNTQRYSKLLWRNNCSFNPLYPQGGTWIYNRANWCPGAPVYTWDWELTPYVTPGDTVNLHYTVDPYQSVEGGGAYYAIETQLISYGAPNFTLDAAVWDIKSPSSKDVDKRINPICSFPKITIKNTGSTTLTSLTITYGIEGGPQSVYHWTGSLAFLDTVDVELPTFAWSSGNKFKATVSNPNGGVDQYPYNDYMESTYSMPPQYPNSIVFDLMTDAHYNQYGNNEGSYTITNDAGTVVWQRTAASLAPSTVYKDTVNFLNGCYTFHFTDDLGATDPTDPNYKEGDGMTNWPDQTNTVGHLFFRRASSGTIFRSFGMDFGHDMYQQFTVGYYLDLPTIASENVMTVYPNPSKGIFNLDMSFNDAQDVTVVVYDMMGARILDETLKNVSVLSNKIDLSSHPDGIYFITAQSKDKRLSKKIIKSN
ncbi:MAG: peptide-N-glycosidase F-related protein [Bacteroidota bacterium]